MGIADEMKGEFFQLLAMLGIIGVIVFMFFAISYSIWLFVIPIVLIAIGYFFLQSQGILR